MAITLSDLPRTLVIGNCLLVTSLYTGTRDLVRMRIWTLHAYDYHLLLHTV